MHSFGRGSPDWASADRPEAVYPPERGCRGLGRSENRTLVARTTGAERQGGFCRPAERPFIPLKGGAGGWEGRRIRCCPLEQRRMAVVQLGENALHRCLAENCGTFLDTETVTILLYGGQFLIVQVNHLTMSAPEGSLAHFKIFRIRNRRTLLFPCQNCLSLEKNEPGKKRFHTLGETPTTFPVAKISIFSEKNGLNHGFRASKGHFCPFFG